MCGKYGLVLPRLGLGTMGMSAFYVANGSTRPCEPSSGPWPSGETTSTRRGSAKNTDTQGTLHHNEALVGAAIAKFGREKFIIATKFGLGLARRRKTFGVSSAKV